MNKAYANMRNFWLDVKNLDNRKGILEIGPEKIAIAGVEMTISDGKGIKHLMIATNSLGDCSLYFENNSKSGIGGMIGGHNSEKLQEAAARMLAHASKLTSQMQVVNKKEWKELETVGMVRFFAVSKDKIFIFDLSEEKARNVDESFYPFFAYSQQMMSCFKEQASTSTTARA